MMDERERRDIMLRAIHRYGEAAQIDMAVEEMAELTKALCKVKRATPGASTTPSAAPAPRWPPARHTASPPTPWS